MYSLPRSISYYRENMRAHKVELIFALYLNFGRTKVPLFQPLEIELRSFR